MASKITQQTTTIPVVPIRTPMQDAQGNLTQPWIAFFQNGNSNAGPPGADGVGTGGVNAQTASYAATLADDGKLVAFNSASAVTLTLPNPPLSETWSLYVEDVGAGTLTVSPNGLLIDGAAASLAVPTGNGVYISTDGKNYFTERGLAPAFTLTPPVTLAAAIASALLTLNQTGTGGGLVVSGGSTSAFAAKFTGGDSYTVEVDASATSGLLGLLVKANNGTAIYGEDLGSGFGVEGSSATNNGVYGTCSSGSGAGVFGNSPGGGPGVWGAGNAGQGVEATSLSGNGLTASTGSAAKAAIQTQLSAGGNGAIASGAMTLAQVTALTPSAGWMQYCSDAQNFTDDVAAVGSVAVGSGHGCIICYLNGSWRSMA